MYKRQLISTLSLIFLCLLLLGTGFFSLYYQYQLSEMKKLLQQDVTHISEYVEAVLSSEEDLESVDFLRYLSSVAKISNTTVLLCDTAGIVVHATGAFLSEANPSGDGSPPQSVPSWAVNDTLNRREFTGLTTFNGLFNRSSYVTSAPIVTPRLSFTPQGPTQTNVPVAVIFLAKDASYVQDFLHSALQMFLLTALAVLLISMVICSITAQHLVQPLHAMSATAYRFARGELDARVSDYSCRSDEIGDLAKAFNTMADSLGQSEKRRSEFVANVSHELKTPMTTIAGFAEGILDGTIPPHRERESLEIISSETRRLSRLIRRMLELSRLQSQERIAAQVQFDVGELLLRVLVSLEAKVMEKDLEVVTDLPEPAAMVWGEPDAITQVCYNLLDNALKFSKQGGVLTLSIESRAGKAYITIRNQGPTIPAEQLPEVFERFHKADPSRTEKDGVGLGLYIVKTILNTYKEDITVTSENGETAFTFSLSEV